MSLNNLKLHKKDIKKDTLLFVLEGKIKLKTLTKSFILKKNDFILIERKVFHQSKSLSKNGVLVLEFETPINKFDLLRVYDKYNRTLNLYETKISKKTSLKKSLFMLVRNKLNFINPKNIKKLLVKRDYTLLVIDKLFNKNFKNKVLFNFYCKEQNQLDSTVKRFKRLKQILFIDNNLKINKNLLTCIARSN